MSPFALSRRTVLAGSAATAGLLASAEFAASAPLTNRMFRHGVASGDPRPHSVVLWTRVWPTTAAAPGSGKGPRSKVTWQVATDRSFKRIVRSGSLTTGPGRDHTVKVDATRLPAGRWFYYRFKCRGVTSPVGRTRTAPAATASPARFRAGVVSCSHFESGYFAAYRHLAQRNDLDAILHLGDYLYEYGPGEGNVRSHLPTHEIVSTADYRQRHAQYKQDPDLLALHARYPFIVTWDDHEITNDNWRDGAENHDPDQGEGSYAARKLRAARVYDEWMPVRMNGTAAILDGTKLFRSLRWGRLAEINMLDLRSYRDQQISTPAPFPLPQLQTKADDPDRTITGNGQMAWLKNALKRNTAQWKLIGNSVVIAPLSFAQLPTDAVAAINEVTGEIPSDGIPLNLDQWDGYTADRKELFGFMKGNQIKDTVFLTGDIHSGWANDLPLDAATYPLSGSVGVEFVCTSVTSANIDDVTKSPPRTSTLAIEAVLRANNRHIKHLNFDDHGYSVLDVTPQRAQMDYYVLADRTKRGTTAAWSASWQTLAGSQRVSRASGPVK